MTYLCEDFYTFVTFVDDCHVDGFVSFLIGFVEVGACFVELPEHLREVVESCPMYEWFFAGVYFSRPIGDIGSLNCPNINFPVLVIGSFFSQQINVLFSAVHAGDIDGGVSQISSSVEDGVVVFEGGKVEGEVG